MRKNLLIATLLSALGLFGASPAQADEHLMKVNEVMTIGDGDPTVQFVELRDAFEEGFPNTYELNVYNLNGANVDEQAVSQSGLQATNTNPYLLATPAAESALGVNADEALTLALPGRGQICFTRGNPAETKIYCMAYGCVDTVVSGAQAGATERSPAPREDESISRSSGGTWTRTSPPTPDASNTSGSSAPNCPGPQTFTVDQKTDEPDLNIGDGVCDAIDTAGAQCTLRAAIEEANVSASNDTLAFAPDFNGEAGDAVSLSSSLPTITEEVTINGGDCDPSGNSKPCAAVDANTATFGLSSVADGVDIRRLAVYDAINPIVDGDGATVKGSWFGIGLDGSAQGNVTGLLVQGDGATIGGTTAADRNLFANNETGLALTEADNARVRGNHFGLEPEGDTVAPNIDAIRIQGTMADDATGNVIGATVSSTAAGTATCDGGCNVIVGSSDNGIELGTDDGFTTAPEDTTIKGNFIGLLPAGAIEAGNLTGIDVGDAKGALIGGTGSADRNFITGDGIGSRGIHDDPADDSRGLEIKRNFVGLRSSGAFQANPPEVGIAVFSDAGDPDLVSRNRLAGDADTFPAIAVGGSNARVVRNKVGLGKNGENVGGGFVGIQVTGRSAKIGEPGAGNTIGNIIGPAGVGILIEAIDPGGFADTGDSNKVQGNFIGVDPAGVARPNAGSGIKIQDLAAGDTPEDNVIGGTSSATENVISNSTSSDAILIQANSMDTPNENQVKRNRGKNNGLPDPNNCSAGACNLFIEIAGNGAPDGFGNTALGPQGGVEAPELNEAQTSRSATKGTCEPGATIYVFRTSDPAGASPKRINAFVKTATCGTGGNFSASFSKIPSGQRLTALQIDSENASELAEAVAP